jgi:hypothetical protein
LFELLVLFFKKKESGIADKKQGIKAVDCFALKIPVKQGSWHATRRGVWSYFFHIAVERQGWLSCRQSLEKCLCLTNISFFLKNATDCNFFLKKMSFYL